MNTFKQFFEKVLAPPSGRRARNPLGATNLVAAWQKFPSVQQLKRLRDTHIHDYVYLLSDLIHTSFILLGQFFVCAGFSTAQRGYLTTKPSNLRHGGEIRPTRTEETTRAKEPPAPGNHPGQWADRNRTHDGPSKLGTQKAVQAKPTPGKPSKTAQAKEPPRQEKPPRAKGSSTQEKPPTSEK